MLRSKRSQSRPVPGPSGLELLRGLRALQRDPLDYVTLLQRRYGDLVRIRLGPQDIYLATSPALIQESCRGPSAFIRGKIARRARQVIGPSLIVSEGPEWKRHRRLMSPSFRQRFVECLSPAVDAAASEWLRLWDDAEGGSVDVEHAAQQYTLDSACRAIFGQPLRSEANAIGLALTDVLDLTVQRAREVLPLPLWVPTSRHRSFAQRRHRADVVLDALLSDARRKQPDTSVAAHLARAAEASGEMSHEQLKAETFGLLFSGYESPTRALTWTLHLLAKHPDVQARARELLRSAARTGSPSGSDYLNAVIKEAMRLFPPGWILGREAAVDTRLGAYEIKKGAFLMYSAWVTHRRADLWEAPLEFRPERFLNRAGPGGADFTYFPFGLPPHHCIGAGFALLQARAALAPLLENFEFSQDGADPQPVAEATVRPSTRVLLRPRRLKQK